MPIYEYKCKTCGKTFELLLRSSQSAPDACPDCRGPVEKLMSAPGAVGVAEQTYAPQHPGTCCGMEGGCDSPKRCCGH